ncbi:MAG: hypothetical protein ACXVDD_22970, partial [Polyangia bacterium]
LWPRRATWVRPLFVAAVAAELLFACRGETPSTTMAAAEARPAAIDWLREHSAPGRTTNDVHLGNAFHNMGMRWRFESAGGYHSLPIWRYLNLLWIANHGAPYPRAQLGDDLTGQGLWNFASPIVDLLSVQWVMAPRDRPISAPGWTRELAGDDGIDVWRNHRTLPRAFVVYAAERVADEAAAARAIASPKWNPTRAAVVEEDVNLPPPPPGVPPTQTTQLVREGPTMLLLEVPAMRPGMLIVGEPWYPGWRVTVDGAPARLLRVDYALRGVRLEPGVHIVAMELSCPPLQAGACVTIAALLLAAALTSADARRRRRGASAA